MNGSDGQAEAFPPGHFPGGTTVLVELTPDIHICGLCKQQFNHLDAFVAHKQGGCQLPSAAATSVASTVQFVSEEAVQLTQPQNPIRTITSETQTITVSAPDFVFEHGYQTYLPSENSEPRTAAVVSAPPKSRSRKSTALLAQKKLDCCFPGCQFKTAYGMKDMERHLKTHTGDKPHGCEVCGKCFSRKDKLKMHTRSHTGEKPYKCKDCSYAAADSSSLNKHRRIHSNERPFKCQICPYASRNSSQLTVHLRSHTGDAPFQCQLCSAKFKINSDLKRHARVHSGEKPYQCEVCEFRCAMKGNLKSHTRIRHNSENPVSCPECDFQCGSKTSLRLHARAHQPEQPVKCPDCSYSCSSKAALKVHERVHSADRPFKCQFCGFDTKQRSNLTTHMRKAHRDKVKARKPSAEKKEGAAPKPAASRQAAKLDAKKAFGCDCCEASFVRQDSLRSHRKQHGECQEARTSELAVLQLQVDPGRQGNAAVDVGHLQVPFQPSQETSYGESIIKVIVGHQLPQANAAAQGAALNPLAPGLLSPNRQDVAAGGQLEILRQVGLVASDQPLVARHEARAVGHQAVLLAAHDQNAGGSLHQTLISAALRGPESLGNQLLLPGAGIGCCGLDAFGALMQEGAAGVTMDGAGGGGGDAAVAASAPPPLFSAPSHVEAPKPAWSIMQDGAQPALLCPADSIPD
ncbi:LOW QUALITY PROTEIN: zinc finger protein 64 [Rhinatrema bivittatum]|uniref:LOW QUALITY PROTEIN: zinc finger protein 64 n=1 Tax=Rhinatrema bivittatum TaxID=194408 RepID=UPI00112D58BC|nr:LOW QUALITY PROTEIN: zinc finger protein 64 [Rhinatrema bivittatum]